MGHRHVIVHGRGYGLGGCGVCVGSGVVHGGGVRGFVCGVGGDGGVCGGVRGGVGGDVRAGVGHIQSSNVSKVSPHTNPYFWLSGLAVG